VTSFSSTPTLLVAEARTTAHVHSASALQRGSRPRPPACAGVATDVRVFKQAVSKRQWPKAVELYRGKLLEGLRLPVRRVRSWLELSGELQEVWREAVLSFAGSSGDPSLRRRRRTVGKLYKADPLDETVAAPRHGPCGSGEAA